MSTKLLNAASGFLAAVVIPIAVVLLGNTFSESLKERELQGRFVELSVDILSDEPTDQNKPIREWATAIINEYSGVPLGSSAEQTLIEQAPIRASAIAQSRPHAVLVTTLKWHLGERDVPFAEVLSWNMSRLGIDVAGQSEEPTRLKAKALAELLDNSFLNLYRASYRSGVDRQTATLGLETMLLDAEKTVLDLGDLVGRYYQFRGEP